MKSVGSNSGWSQALVDPLFTVIPGTVTMSALADTETISTWLFKPLKLR